MAKKQGKLKNGRIVLLVLLGILLALVLGAFAIVKIYLGQLGQIDKNEIEIIAPEDEFFDVDVVWQTPAASTPVQTPQGTPAQTPQGTPAAPEAPVGTGSAPGADNAPEQGTDPVPGGETAPSGDVLNIDPEDVEWPFIERIEDDHLINILLVGQDKYPGTEGEGRQRSDSMILCSIHPETGRTSLISFMRDMYVEIPGDYSDNRLNTPYVFGGFPLLDETLALNFGVSVDANILVDMAGFKAIIDMLGGVNIELSAEEADYFRTNWGSDLRQGVNRLSADQALWYSQLRKIGSDFARTGRQRKVLMAVFQEVKQLPANELLTLMYDILPYITTDMTTTQILSLAYRLLPLVPSVSVETHRVPAEGSYSNATIRNMSVLLPDREKIRQQLQDEYLPLN